MLPGRRLLLLLRSTHLPVQPLEDRGWACFLRVRRDKMSSRQADFTGDAARDASIEKCLTQRSIDMDTGKAEGAVEEIAGKVSGRSRRVGRGGSPAKRSSFVPPPRARCAKQPPRTP